MKKLAIIATLAFALILGSIPVQAGDVILSSTIASVTPGVTSDGRDYVRAIINTATSLDGIEYERQVPLMFFGDLAAQAREFVAGQEIKVVAGSREYQGRPSFVAYKIVQ